MIKLNSVVYNKIVLQYEEAKDQGLVKLAEGIHKALADKTLNNSVYSYEDLEKNIYAEMWKAAFNVVGYHNLESVDIQKLDATISDLSFKILKEIEASLDKEDQFGPNEPALLGQK